MFSGSLNEDAGRLSEAACWETGGRKTATDGAVRRGIEATCPYEPGKEPEDPGSDDEEDADPEEGEIPQLRVNPDGSVDFQTVSDWWAEMGQKCNTDWFRIGVDKKDEGRGNG